MPASPFILPPVHYGKKTIEAFDKLLIITIKIIEIIIPEKCKKVFYNIFIVSTVLFYFLPRLNHHTALIPPKAAKRIIPASREIELCGMPSLFREELADVAPKTGDGEGKPGKTGVDSAVTSGVDESKGWGMIAG